MDNTNQFCLHATQFTKACEIKAAKETVLGSSSTGIQDEAMRTLAVALNGENSSGTSYPEPLLNGNGLCAGRRECPYFYPPWKTKEG